ATLTFCIPKEPVSRAARPHGPCRCRRSGRHGEAASAGGTAGTRRAREWKACASSAACRGGIWTFFAWGLPWADGEYSERLLLPRCCVSVTGRRPRREERARGLGTWRSRGREGLVRVGGSAPGDIRHALCRGNGDG